MTATPVVVSAPIDDFLAGAGSSSSTAERVEAIGLGLGLAGTVLAVGIIVFAAFTLRGPVHEARRLLWIAGAAGAAVTIGAALEAAGTAAIVDRSWIDTLTDGESPSAMIRLGAGVLVVVGVAIELASVRGVRADEAVRWEPVSGDVFAIAGVVFCVLSFGFDGHTVTEGPRLVHVALDIVHVTAGGVWFGGVVALVVVARARRGRSSMAPLIIRFSSVATVALVAVAVAGAGMTWLIADGLGDLTGTPWGRRLLAKLALVGVAAAVGGYNHFVVVPKLRHGDAAAEAIARTTLRTEAVVLGAAVVATVLVVRASTS